MGKITFGIPQDLVLFLQRAAQTHVLVETGTNEGSTSRWAAGIFERVTTIEGYRPLFEKVSKAANRPPNVTYMFGDTRDILPSVVDKLTDPAIFWLDAHWCGEKTFGISAECPILEEIATVNAGHSNQSGHVVLVDDARLFLEPPPAPHRATDWPDIAALCRALGDVPGGRYVFVHQDVIVAVPETLRAASVEYLRATALLAENKAFGRPAQRQPSLVFRAIRKLGGRSAQSRS